LNEKTAGVNFMRNTGELDFGSGFTSTSGKIKQYSKLKKIIVLIVACSTKTEVVCHSG
jgi:hypothetical protein